MRMTCPPGWYQSTTSMDGPGEETQMPLAGELRTQANGVELMARLILNEVAN
jgi:hypothetical protein